MISIVWYFHRKLDIIRRMIKFTNEVEWYNEVQLKHKLDQEFKKEIGSLTWKFLAFLIAENVSYMIIGISAMLIFT